MRIDCHHTVITASLLTLITPHTHIDASPTTTSPIDERLLNDILPPSSDLCQVPDDDDDDNSTSFSFTYTPSSSKWTNNTFDYEPLKFLVEMTHNDSNNPNRSWSMRLGSGGDVYSFVGPYGEAIPPQNNPELAPWIDEIFQMVSVDQTKNSDPEDGPFFVHQAGSYMMDGNYTPPPFFSPTIAHYCSSNECLIASWGQMSYMPTHYQTHVIYVSRYKNCGNGVIEYSSAIHNMDEVSPTTTSDSSDNLDFLNVPWGGVRSSTLRSLVLSPSDEEEDVWDFPINGFSNTQEAQIRQEDTRGYTIFAESLPLPDDVHFPQPCEVQSGSCQFWGWTGDMDLQLVIARNGSAMTYSNDWSEPRGLNCFKVTIETLDEIVGYGCPACNLLFTNERSGDSLIVTDVLSWAAGAYDFRFCPDDDEEMTVSKINAMFVQGDRILVDYADRGKPADDNLAFGIVHGRDGENEDPASGIYRPSIVQYGVTYDTKRDYTVFCSTAWIDIRPQDTYVRRSYILTGEYTGMNERALPWVDETIQDFYIPGDFDSTTITLYSFPDSNDHVFGATVSSEPCGDADNGGKMVCIGRSAPTAGMEPLYFITCGDDDQSVVTEDPYYFARDEAYYNRPYTCRGDDKSVRPTWKLLGYFETGSCDVLGSAMYDPTICSTSKEKVDISILLSIA